MSNRISRPIGLADLEFYETHMIEVAAKALFDKGDQAWESVSGLTRTRWRKRAAKMLQAVLGDRRVVERLPLLSSNLLTRK